MRPYIAAALMSFFMAAASAADVAPMTEAEAIAAWPAMMDDAWLHRGDAWPDRTKAGRKCLEVLKSVKDPYALLTPGPAAKDQSPMLTIASGYTYPVFETIAHTYPKVCAWAAKTPNEVGVTASTLLACVGQWDAPELVLFMVEHGAVPTPYIRQIAHSSARKDQTAKVLDALQADVSAMKANR